MPGGAGLIIANGAELIAPITIGNIPKVAGITPPTLNNSILAQAADGAVNYIACGTAPAAAGATETFRTTSGIISEGASTDSVVLGRGANAPGAVGRGIAIGTGAGGGNNESIAIGYNASAGGQASVIIIGSGANINLAAGVVIGPSAHVWGNAGGSAGVAIGSSVDARCNAAGITLAIGQNAQSGEGDTVIGNSASSNLRNVFSNYNTVIGQQATSNKAQGRNTVIGALAGSSLTDTVCIGYNAYTNNDRNVIIGSLAHGDAGSSNNIIIGQSVTSTHADNILIGHGLTSAAANYCMIGGPNTDIRNFLIGNGNTSGAPAARLVRFTNATGANIAANAVTFQAPLSTGNAAEAGFAIAVGTVQAAGSTTHVATTRLNFTPGGVAWNESTAPAGAAAVFQTGSRGRHIFYGYNTSGDSMSMRQVVIGHAPGYIAYRGNGTPAVPTAVANNDTLMNLAAGGYDGAAWSVLTSANIQYQASEAWGAAAKGARLNFQVTKNGTTAQTTAMTLEHDGSVLINPIAAATTALKFGANAALGAAGAGVGTLNNLPAAVVAGNPAVYLIVDINGTPTYFPGWQ